MTGSPPPTAYYGSRKKADAPDYVYLVPTYIREIFGAWAEPLTVPLQAMQWTAIETFSMCSKPPPDMEALLHEGGMPLARLIPELNYTSIDVLMDAAIAHIWPTYCEYLPAPAPELPPPPAAEPVNLPPTVPDIPLPPAPEPLEGPDLAAQLAAQLSLIKTALSTLDWLRANVTVRQYGFGTEFAIEGTSIHQHAPAVGYIIEASYPPHLGVSAGAIPRVFDAGFVSYGHERQVQGFAEGMPWGFRLEWDLSDTVRLTRPRQFLWTGGVEATLFGWELRPGVSGVVTPLLVSADTP